MMKNKIPFITAHRNLGDNNAYLHQMMFGAPYFTIKSSLLYDNPTYMLCDELGSAAARCVSEDDRFGKCEIFDIEQFSSDPMSQEFLDNYLHLSFHVAAEEDKFCILRWFILRNFMSTRKIKKCFFADSDVMTLCNLDEEHERYFSKYRVSCLYDINGPSSPAQAFVHYDWLCEFTNFILQTYKRENILLKILSECYFNSASDKKDEYYVQMSGWKITDMTFIRQFAYLKYRLWGHRDRFPRNETFGNLTKIIDHKAFGALLSRDGEGATLTAGYHPCCTGVSRIACPHDFDIEDIIKEEGGYYIRKDSKKIKLQILHFPGGAKEHMKRILTL